MNKLLLTTTEAARVLCVGRSRIYQLINSGELQSVKVGTSRRIPTQAIDEYVSHLIEDLGDDAA